MSQSHSQIDASRTRKKNRGPSSDDIKLAEKSAKQAKILNNKEKLQDSANCGSSTHPQGKFNSGTSRSAFNNLSNGANLVARTRFAKRSSVASTDTTGVESNQALSDNDDDTSPHGGSVTVEVNSQAITIPSDTPVRETAQQVARLDVGRIENKTTEVPQNDSAHTRVDAVVDVSKNQPAVADQTEQQDTPMTEQTEAYPSNNDVRQELPDASSSDLLQDSMLNPEVTEMVDEEQPLTTGPREYLYVGEPTRNIDAIPSQSELYVSAYARDIIRFLKESEVHSMPSGTYINDQLQPNFTPNMRAVLVSWLHEVVDEFRCHTETLHLAVNYLDRFLSRVRVDPLKLQLIGATCLWIASKYEEIRPPSVDEFVFIAADTFSRREFFQTERMLLRTLNFHLVTPTRNQYLHRFLRSIEACRSTCALSLYLTDLSLIGYPLVGKSPCVVAACTVALAASQIYCTGWNPNLSYFSGVDYEQQETRIVLDQILIVWRSAFQNQQGHTFGRYSTSQYHHAALIVPPETNPIENFYAELERSNLIAST